MEERVVEGVAAEEGLENVSRPSLAVALAPPASPCPEAAPAEAPLEGIPPTLGNQPRVRAVLEGRLSCGGYAPGERRPDLRHHQGLRGRIGHRWHAFRDPIGLRRPVVPGGEGGGKKRGRLAVNVEPWEGHDGREREAPGPRRSP